MKRQPVLNTKRLLLRQPAAGDAGIIRKLAGAKEVAEMTLTIPHPYSFKDAVDWIERSQKEWKKGSAATFVITLGERGDLCGGIGLMLHPQHRNAEIGFWIGVPYWNRGICTEAAGAILHFAFEDLSLHRVFAQHFPHNPASGRVMLKTGMKYEGRLREHVCKWDRFEDVLCYGILKSDWLPEKK